MKKKLPKRAKNLLECIECHIQTCAEYKDGIRLPANTVAFGVISILAGSLNLHPDVHKEFSKSGWTASRAQIKACNANVRKLVKKNKKSV
jgi:hypothetical protein